MHYNQIIGREKLNFLQICNKFQIIFNFTIDISTPIESIETLGCCSKIEIKFKISKNHYEL